MAKTLSGKLTLVTKCNVIMLDLFKRISRAEKIDQSSAAQLVAYVASHTKNCYS